MQVMKFGGAALKDERGFYAMSEILSGNNNEPILVVISALSKVTRQLNEIALISKSGDEEQASKKIDDIIANNIALGAKLLIQESQSLLNNDVMELSTKLKSIIRGIAITKELTPRTLDYVLSFGEYFALRTVYYFLKEQNFAVDVLDSADIIVTDENFGNANPDYELSLRKCLEYLMPNLVDNKIVLTQGFVARTKSGKISTMGIESSNLTATFFALALGSDEVTFWTDVEGIRSADPLLVDDTVGIDEINYEDAYRASIFGLKLIHYKMIKFAESSNIKLVFRSIFNPLGNSTQINRTASKKSVVTYIENLQRSDLSFWPYIDISQLPQILYKFFDNFNINKHLFFTGNNLAAIYPSSSINNNIFSRYFNKTHESITLVAMLNPNKNEHIKHIIELFDSVEIFDFYFSDENHYCLFVINNKFKKDVVEYLNKLLS